jgi:hypothetical protein
MIVRHKRTFASAAETFISNPRDKAQLQGASPANARLAEHVASIMEITSSNLLDSALCYNSNVKNIDTRAMHISILITSRHSGKLRSISKLCCDKRLHGAVNSFTLR